MSKNLVLAARKTDQLQINMVTDAIFSFYTDGMYFDEFVELTEKITSEFAFGILDCLYTHVPCI